MRKKLYILAAALCAMLTLAACESSTPVSSTPVQAADDPNAPTYTVTLDPAGGTMVGRLHRRRYAERQGGQGR